MYLANCFLKQIRWVNIKWKKDKGQNSHDNIEKEISQNQSINRWSNQSESREYFRSNYNHTYPCTKNNSEIVSPSVKGEHLSRHSDNNKRSIKRTDAKMWKGRVCYARQQQCSSVFSQNTQKAFPLSPSPLSSQTFKLPKGKEKKNWID